jgi:chemotaxis protein methyltransferase WspC
VKALERLLEGHLGLDCASLGPSALAAALSTRMKETGVSGRAEYIALAGSDERELAKLVEEVVVSETWFMRDGEPFAELARLARQHTGSEPLRVLTLPCATGEEPFSVVITLLEVGLPAGFSVDAVDVSQRALAQAARGVFGERAFRGDDGGLRQRWFSRTPEGWAIDPALLRHVQFRNGNVLDPALASGQRYRAVFCRNLLIYLGSDARARAIGNLKRMLAPGGTLFVGHAESLERMDPSFARVGPTAAFAYRLRAAGQEPARTPRTALAQRPSAAASVNFSASGTGSAPQLSPLDPAPRPAPPREAALDPLDQAQQYADGGRLEDAQALCERYLSREPADPRAHTLLGVVLSARGDLAGARRSLERALYLAPEREEAIAHLIALHERLGDAPRAEALGRRAARVRNRREGGA